MVTKKVGLEQRLRDVAEGKAETETPKDEVKKKPTLQEVMDGIDLEEAQDVLKARAEQRKAEYLDRARQLTERQSRGGTPVTTIDPNTEVRKHITDQAVYLLTQGVDPKIVGQILQGSAATGPNPVILSPSGGAQQGLTIADVISLLDRIETRKGSDGELTRVLDKLEKLGEKVEGFRAEIEDVKGGRYTKQESVSPADALKQQIDLLKTAREMATEMGWVKQEVTATGEPIDIVREKNRHLEKMEEVKVEAEHKERIGNIAASIPEMIGEGVGKYLLNKGEGESPDTGGLPTYPCTCGHKIVIPPGAPESITCGKCGAIYSKGTPKQEPLKQEPKSEAKKEA